MNGGARLLLRVVWLCAALAPATGALADGSDVSFDAGVDFRSLKSFTIRDGQITTYKPEIDNRLFRQRLEAGIRATLLKKGLVETAAHPDVSVTYYFYDKDVSAVERQGPVRVPDTPTARGFVIPGSGPSPVLYTEGTLVIDLTDASNSLLWRGTWRDQENSGPTLSRKLSEDARKLLSKYPPKK